MVLRFFMLAAHYRSPINFSSEHLEQAGKALERLNTLIYKLLERQKRVAEGVPSDEEQELLRFLQASGSALSKSWTMILILLKE